MHRNSQKRYYIKNAVYFITTNTHDRIEYFNENILCDLLVEDLWETQRLKCFDIFAYKINPEHLHALIQPRGKDSYSEIMRSFKTNFSRNANRMMGFDANFEKLFNPRQAGLSLGIPGQTGSRDPACNGVPHNPGRIAMSRDVEVNPIRQISILNEATYLSRIAGHRRWFVAKYNDHPPFPKFKWQSSFHDHIIRDGRDFVTQLDIFAGNG